MFLGKKYLFLFASALTISLPVISNFAHQGHQQGRNTPNPNMIPYPEKESEPHWWEANTLTISPTPPPPLLPTSNMKVTIEEVMT